MRARPYRTDGEYLGQEFRWIEARIARIKAEQEARNGGYFCGDEDKHDRSLSALRAREADLRHRIDDRLTAHRKIGRFDLGLDRLCREHDLNQDERLVALALTAPAISDTTGNVLDGLGTAAGAWTSASDCMTLLDPPGIDGLLRARRIVVEGGSLHGKGVLEVRDSSTELGARAKVSTYLYLSQKAFEVVVGAEVDEAVEGEGEVDEGEVEAE